MNLWNRARAEGRIPEMSVGDKALYLLKYLVRPQLWTTQEIRAVFEEQRRLRSRQKTISDEILTTLGFVGDLMWIRRNWEGFLSPRVSERLGRLDGLVGNLETVISSRIPVNEILPDLLRFNSKPGLITSFRHKKTQKNLFAALSFANNHTLDHGDEAALDTLEFLRQEGIPQSGLAPAGGKRWTEFSRGGIRFGFYAATFGVNDDDLLQKSRLQLNVIPGLARDTGAADLGEAEQVLAEMESAGIEIKIVSLHWGHEFEFYPTEKMRAVARELVTKGADVIVGSHPHTAQPPEILFVNGYDDQSQGLKAPGRDRKALVFYSLGNFTTAMFRPYCRLAVLWRVSFFRGRWGLDWSWPEAEFFYNRNLNYGTELVCWEDHSADAVEKKWIEWIQNHLR